MENKDLIIIVLIVATIYLYYQNQKSRKLPTERVFIGTDNSTSQTLLNLLNVNSLEELKTKLGEKTLNELLEENEDYETEVDTLTRTKQSLEADLLAQSQAFKSRQKEKDSEIKKVKEDLTSEKQQHKGSLARITKLTEQKAELEKEQQEQLRKINLLFDEKAKDYKTIDFNGLYALLEKVKLEKPEIKETPIEVHDKKEEVD